MQRIIGALGVAAAVLLSTAAVAQAAGPPTATTGVASDVTNTTAVLNAHVDPHGVTTDYTFNYGLTPAYSQPTVAHSAGARNVPRHVSVQITGLLPGTTYHFQVSAVSASGSVAGADATFTTTGVAPSSVATGLPSNVGRTVATLTGTVVPGDASTLWQVQYGRTTSYGLETAPQSLIAGSVPDPLSIGLAGLAPAELFHYRFVAYHGPIGAPSTVISYGADASFYTKPSTPPSAGMTTVTKPGSDATSPYTFTTSGRLRGGGYIPAPQRCSGTVAIRYYNGKRQLAHVLSAVGSDCRFSGRVSFRKTDGHGAVGLRVSIYYRGNGYLHSESKTDHPKAGR